MLGEDVACIIYIGNILDEAIGIEKLINKLSGREYLIDSLEKNFKYEQCEALGSLIETYIHALIDNVPSANSDSFNPLIENIKNYIESNLEYNVNVKQIAMAFKYNEQYLGRIFKKETNLSFCDYINKQRIKRAKVLLEKTNDSIINISSSVGFNNVTYFNRLFKKHLNISPSEYRYYVKNKFG